MELDLLDGSFTEALRQGDWAVVALWASVLAVGLVSGVIAWLKGRKVLALLAWIVLGGVAVAVLAPQSWVETVVGTDRTTASWLILGVVGAALAIGVTASWRLAKPSSWWAQRRYDNDKYALTINRHRWTKVKAK